MAPPPAWAGEGAVLGATGGAKAVNDSFNVLKEAGVPVAAIWSQVRLAAHGLGARADGLTLRTVSGRRVGGR